MLTYRSPAADVAADCVIQEGAGVGGEANRSDVIIKEERPAEVYQRYVEWRHVRIRNIALYKEYFCYKSTGL